MRYERTREGESPFKIHYTYNLNMKLFSINCLPFETPGSYRTSWSLVVIYFLFISSSYASEELLLNTGFNGNYTNGVAEKWRDNSSWADVDVEYKQSSDAVEGKSQYIRCKRVTSGAVQFVQQGISLVKGQNYQISIWIKGHVNGPVDIMLRKQGGPYTVYARKAFRITNQWSRYEFITTSYVDDPGSYFMVRFTGKGELWLDQASVQKISAPMVSVTPKLRNLIANGSFEVGLDRWAVNVRGEGGYRNEMPVRFTDVRPTIITGEVPHGNQALHVALPPHGRAIVTTEINEITPGHRYTLSLWLKSKNVNSKVGVKLSTGWDDKIPLGRTFKITPEWQRYEFTVLVPGNNYHLRIETIKPSSDLWIDKVQLIAGKSKTFKPRVPVEIGFTRSNNIPLYYKHDPIKLEFCFSAYQSLNGVYTVQVNSIDFYENEQVLFEEQFSFEVPKKLCRSFSHQTDKTGHFQIHAKIQKKDGILIDSSTVAIGIVPRTNRLPAASSPFGGHATFSPTSLNAMKMLGVSWLRLHPPLGTKWFIVEPEKNNFQFIDEPIQFAKKMGFHILGSLDSTPRWASSAPNHLKTERSEGYRSYPPNKITDWENYVYQTVAHYKGTIDHWEIWNEPDGRGFFKLNGPLQDWRKPEAYVQLVKSAYIASKRANPNAVIVAGVGSRKPPINWISKLIDNDILDYADVISFHYYTDGRPGDALDVTTGDQVNELRSLINAKGRSNIPVWETESGYALKVCDYNSAVDKNIYCAKPEESVAFIVRSYIEWLSSGIEHWFFYSMFLPDRTDRLEFTNFFSWDRSPTALALAYAVTSNILTDTTFSRKVHPGKKIAGAEFISPNRRIRILWLNDDVNKHSRHVSITPSPEASNVQVINSMGNVIASNNAGTNIDVEINIDPVFIVEYF